MRNKLLLIVTFIFLIVKIDFVYARSYEVTDGEYILPDLYVEVINKDGITIEYSDYDCDDVKNIKKEKYCSEFDNEDDYNNCILEYDFTVKICKNGKNGKYTVPYGEKGILRVVVGGEYFNDYFIPRIDFDLKDEEDYYDKFYKLFLPVYEYFDFDVKNISKKTAYVFKDSKLYSGPTDIFYKEIDNIKANTKVKIYKIIHDAPFYSYINYNDRNYWIKDDNLYEYKEGNLIVGKDIKLININDKNDTKILKAGTKLDNYYSGGPYEQTSEFYMKKGMVYFDGTYFGYILNPIFNVGPVKIKLEKDMYLYDKVPDEKYSSDGKMVIEDKSSTIIKAGTILETNYHYEWNANDEYSAYYYVKYNNKYGWIALTSDFEDPKNYITYLKKNNENTEKEIVKPEDINKENNNNEKIDKWSTKNVILYSIYGFDLLLFIILLVRKK